MVQTPILRSANKVPQLYPLNQFPSKFPKSIAKSLYAIIATSTSPRDEVDVSGKLWEEIFAKGIDAKRESGLAEGLDDIRDDKTSTAWSAKTVKHDTKTSLHDAIRRGSKKVQLISGRNNLHYSYDFSVNPKEHNPNIVAEKVLGIWNERVKTVRTQFANLRTVVMVKELKRNTVAIFEKTTEMYDVLQYEWEWNKNGNLVGARDNIKHFTWQPNGSQFTINNIIVPKDSLIVSFDEPERLNVDDILQLTGWDDKNFKII